MRHHLHSIQRSDKETKLRWLIGLTAAATVVVIALWVIYMRAFVLLPTGTATEEQIDTGYWSLFTRGVSETVRAVGSSITGSAMPSFGSKRTVIEGGK